MGYTLALLLATRTLFFSGDVVAAQDTAALDAGEILQPFTDRLVCFISKVFRRDSDRCTTPIADNSKPPLAAVITAVATEPLDKKQEEGDDEGDVVPVDAVIRTDSILAEIDGLRRELTALQGAQQNTTLPTPTLIFSQTAGQPLSREELIARIDELRAQLMPLIIGARRSPQNHTSKNYLRLSGGALDGSLSIGGGLSVSGATTFNGIAYTWPSADGSSGQVLSTDGTGGLSWETAAGGGGGFSGGELVAEFITATGTAATSTFAHSISIATDAEYRINGRGVLTKSGTALLVGTLTGNARGSSALDIQNFRSFNTEVASGDYSVAVGNQLVSSGVASLALGFNQKASGDYSIIIGTAGTVAGASGYASLAIGYRPEAVGDYSAAFGPFSQSDGDFSLGVGAYADASGPRSSAIGYENIASGDESTAIGKDNTASGDYSVAVGHENQATSTLSSAIGVFNQAGDWEAVAIGYNNRAGYESVAIGNDNRATGFQSTAAGYVNQATGARSNAFGWANQATASGASAFGNFVINNTANSAMIGPSTAAALHILSTGETRAPFFSATSTSATSTFAGHLSVAGNTAFNGVTYTWPGTNGDSGQVLTTDGNGGLSWDDAGGGGGFAGGELTASHVTATSTTATSTFANHISIATGAEYRINGAGLLTRQANGAVMLGDLTGNGRGVNALDLQTGRFGDATLVASGERAVAFGHGNLAGAENAVAIGVSNEVTATSSFALGQYNQIFSGGYYNIGIGHSNYFNGGADESISIGQFNTVAGSAFRSILLGRAGYVGGSESIAIGSGASASNDQTVAIGVGASASDVGATAVGYSAGASGIESSALGFNNTANGDYSSAIGYANTASGNYASAWGWASTASGRDSTAAGYNNTSFGRASVAAGYGNYAGAFKSSAFGIQNTVSVGGASAFGSSITNAIATSTMIGPSNTAKITILGATGSVGFVGIGTTTPNHLLAVVRSTDGDVASFTDSNGTCTINPTNTALVCSSDERLKTDIELLNSGTSLEKLAQVDAVTFRWKSQDGLDLRYGFIAQNVEATFPEFVTTGTNGYKAVSLTSFIPVLVSAIQELDVKVTALMASAGQSVANGVASFKELIVGKVRTDELCIGETCVTEDELKALLEEADIEQPSDEAPADSEPVPEEPPIQEEPAEETPVGEEPPADEPPADEDPEGEEPAIEEPEETLEPASEPEPTPEEEAEPTEIPEDEATA